LLFGGIIERDTLSPGVVARMVEIKLLIPSCAKAVLDLSSGIGFPSETSETW